MEPKHCFKKKTGYYDDLICSKLLDFYVKYSHHFISKMLPIKLLCLWSVFSIQFDESIRRSKKKRKIWYCFFVIGKLGWKFEFNFKWFSRDLAYLLGDFLKIRIIYQSIFIKNTRFSPCLITLFQPIYHFFLTKFSFEIFYFFCVFKGIYNIILVVN